MSAFQSTLIFLFLCLISTCTPQKLVEDCEGNECAVNCVNGYMSNSSQCICFDIWKGANCTEHKCQNKGIPDSDMSGMHNQTCTCPRNRLSFIRKKTDHFGKYCEKHRCNFHGRSFGSSKLCFCDNGYLGLRCESCMYNYKKNTDGDCVFNKGGNSITNLGSRNNNYDDRDNQNSRFQMNDKWVHILFLIVSIVLGCAFCTVKRSYNRTPPAPELIPPRSPLGPAPIRQPTPLEHRNQQVTQTLLATNSPTSDAPPKYSMIVMQDPPPSYQQATGL